MRVGGFSGGFSGCVTAPGTPIIDEGTPNHFEKLTPMARSIRFLGCKEIINLIKTKCGTLLYICVFILATHTYLKPSFSYVVCSDLAVACSVSTQSFPFLTQRCCPSLSQNATYPSPPPVSTPTHGGSSRWPGRARSVRGARRRRRRRRRAGAAREPRRRRSGSGPSARRR